MKSIFISSTFKDMQAERDYLHEKVFARLRKSVGQYGENIQELDLRWGVDTYRMSEEESGYQVLRVCIDAIDRCKPYIVVLLGARYGWIPDSGLIDSMQDTRLARQYEESMSITNLEIKYGALSEEETLKRCIFCFRNPDFIQDVPEDRRSIYLAESREHERKLRALKEQIQSKAHAKVIEYQVQWDKERQIITGLESFGEAVFRLLEEKLKEDLAGKEAKDSIQQYILDARCTKERYLASYTPKLCEEREAIEGMWFMAGAKYERHHKKYKIAGEEGQCIHLTGGAGSGKSALMAALEQEAVSAGAQTILYFSGNPGCQSTDVLKSVLIYRLEEILKLPHEGEQKNKNAYLRELDAKAEKIPVYCFIDGLDQLFSGSGEFYLDILKLCPNLYVITSAIQDFPYQKALLGARKILVIEVRGFTNEEKKALIQITGNYRGKTMDELLKEQLCKKESSANPLFLSMILQRLFAMRKEEFECAEAMAPGIDGLHLYMEQLIKDMPEKLPEAAAELFRHVSEIFQNAFFQKVAYLIALSETGLTEQETEEILKMQSIEFSQLKFQEILYYLYDVFTENEAGRWVYAHRIFYEAMRRDMGQEEAAIRGYFIRYSEENPDFLEREGFYHILRSKSLQGRQVLEKCRNWTTFPQVKHLVKQMLLNEEEAGSYFLDMLTGKKLEGLFAFWKSVGRQREAGGIEPFLQKVYERCIRNEYLPAELKVETLYEMLSGDSLKAAVEHVQAARLLLPQIKDTGSRNLWKIKNDYMDGWNLLDAGSTEAGLTLLKACADEMAGLFSDAKLQEEAVYSSILYSWIFARESCQRLGICASEYLEKALALYGEYPEYAKIRRFLLTKVELYLEGAAQYVKENPQKGMDCAEKALALARELSEKEPDEKVLHLFAKSLNYYGQNADREHRYQYRYEALNVYKRVYQMEPTDYWQQMTAWQAAFFARDISMLVQQLKLDDREEWMQRGKAAWNLCFSYYEELAAKGYPYIDRANYMDSLLDCAEEAVFKGHINKAVELAGKALSCLREDLQSGWEPKSQKELLRCFRINLLLAENLDNRLCIEEAVSYACEPLEWAKKMYARRATRQNLERILAGLKTAGRVLCHAGRQEEAYAYLEEAKALSDDLCIPSVESEICCLLSQILLEKKEIKNAEIYIQRLDVLQENGQLDFWGSGQLLLLKGDILSAKEKYEAASHMYDQAIVYWEDYHDAVQENIKSTAGFELRGGQARRNVEECLWHVKTFYYYLYGICRKAEAMHAGGLTDKLYLCKSHTKQRRKWFSSACIDHRQEYRCVFGLCMQMLRSKTYRPVTEAFMFQAMDKMLAFGEESQWANWTDMDIFSLLCQMASYCKERNICMDREYQVLADAFCKYDLLMMSTTLAFLHETENCWVDIYRHLKKSIDEGMSIRPCNKFLIGYMWLRLGCYEEAARWLDEVPEEENCFKRAKRCALFCHGMCAYYAKDQERTAEILAELKTLRRADDHYGIGHLKYMQDELEGAVEELLKNEPGEFYIQEEAQRYLHVLKITADKGKYAAFDQNLKNNFWSTARKIRCAYYMGNVRNPEQEDSSDTWEDLADSMKELTIGGMTRRTSFADINEKLFTLFRQIYDSCTEGEESKKLAEQILSFWREEYDRTDLKKLSAENLRMLRKTEEKTNSAAAPALAKELSLRFNNKEILHDFFRRIPEYSEMEDWKVRRRSRKIEIKELFEYLLAQDVKEWAEDFKQWVNTEMWIAGQMDFFQKAGALDQPETYPLYEVYRQYHLSFKEKWRKKWIERLKQCESIQ